MSTGLTVSRVDGAVGAAFVRLHHYSKSCRAGAQCYGLYQDGQLAGVIAFFPPAQVSVRACVFGSDRYLRVTELHRSICLDAAPRNSESFFVSRALRLFAQDNQHIWAVLSYADEWAGHIGTVYQATNAIYTGKSSPHVVYTDQSGKVRADKQGAQHISPARAAKLGWTCHGKQYKHRYLYLLGDRRQKRSSVRMLLLQPQPYPKRAVTCNVQ